MISSIDQRVLDFVHRYRLGTTQVIHRCLLEQHSRQAVTKRLGRLVQRGLLNRYRLFGRRSYYRLGPRATRWLSLSSRHAEPLGEQILPVEYGALGYLCLGEGVHRRLLACEVRQLHPWFPGKLLQRPYYLDPAGATQRLATVRVELSHAPRYVVGKLLRQLHAYYRIEPFRRLMEQGQFLLAVVAASQPRCAALQEEIERHAWSVSFRMAYFDELVHFL